MTEVYDRDFCITCQTLLDIPLTKSIYTKTEVYMFSVLFYRSNSITNVHDTVANDFIYHDICWVKAKWDVEPNTIAI